MSLMQRKRLGAIAALVVFSLVQLGVQVSFAEPNAPEPVPVPQQFVARLTTTGNQPITVNGNSAATGASIVTGATIETGADQSATVNLGPLGSLDIAPNTKLVLTYDENGRVKVTLVTGCTILTAKKKSEGEVETSQGTAAKTDRKKGGVIDICFPPGAAAPIIGQGAASAAMGGAAGGLGVGLPTAVIAAATVATLTPLVGFQDNPSPPNP